MTRDVRSGSGYLSGDPSRSHFGIPAGASTQSLEIRWPDGVLSTIRDLQPNTLVMVTREDTVRLSPTSPLCPTLRTAPYEPSSPSKA